ncbi:MAG: SpoIID/LytB domain-containing protein [Candidatus Chromulinivorax sp.]
MILRYNFMFIGMLLLSTFQFAFDVRVLLDRGWLKDGKSVTYAIGSQHGLSVTGIEKMQSSVTVCCTDKNFQINGVTLQDNMITICPQLPAHCQKKIHQFIIQHCKDNYEFYQTQFLKLDDFYNKFVNDREFRNYAPLYDVMQFSVEHAIKRFIDDIDHPAVSYESLCKQAHHQLSKKLRVMLTDAIYDQNPSKALLEKIKKIVTVRHDFFNKILHTILAQFLTNFFEGLPHKIIAQAIKEETGCLTFDKHTYLGVFYLVRDTDSILCINSLDIDDYLLSVVRSEGWPGWPIEVNKALVIASRTYLVDKILQANKSKRLYHIVNSIKHQTYKGHHKFLRLKQAVDETRDIFIAYKGQPIVAMFDACCGGVIPAKIEGMDYDKHPYLARSKPCNFCKRYWIYNWKKEFSPLELAEIFRLDHPDIENITDVKVVERDAAGLVKRVMISTKKKNYFVSGKKMYSLFPAIKSFCYTIKKKGKSYQFDGKGYGHHIGLCQWGAHGMVQDNWSYTRILQYYYPGTEFMKFSLSR